MFALSKHLRAPIVDVLSDYDLFREFEVYAAAENEATRRRNAEQERKVSAARRRRR